MIKIYLFGFPCFRRSKQVWQIGIEINETCSLENITKKQFDRMALDMQRHNYELMKVTFKPAFRNFKTVPKHCYFKEFSNFRSVEDFCKIHGI